MAITYDAVACQVWLDPLDAAPGGAQPLCGDHAARLSPPRGWVVLDRRDSQASLMTISPPIVEQTGRRGATRRRFPRRWGQFDEPRLEFVGPDEQTAPDRAAPEPQVAAETEPELATEPEPTVPETAVLEPVGDAASTLTALEPQVEVEPDAEPEPAVAAEPEPAEPEPDAEPEPAPVRRAPAADLLKPKGRLLSRAFDVTGDQHSVLTGASGVIEDPTRSEP